MNCDKFVNPNNNHNTDQDIEYFHLIRKFPHALHRLIKKQILYLSR